MHNVVIRVGDEEWHFASSWMNSTILVHEGQSVTLDTPLFEITPAGDDSTPGIVAIGRVVGEGMHCGTGGCFFGFPTDEDREILENVSSECTVFPLRTARGEVVTLAPVTLPND